jgi:hypothetical protein
VRLIIGNSIKTIPMADASSNTTYLDEAMVVGVMVKHKTATEKNGNIITVDDWNKAPLMSLRQFLIWRPK